MTAAVLNNELWEDLDTFLLPFLARLAWLSLASLPRMHMTGLKGAIKIEKWSNYWKLSMWKFAINQKKVYGRRHFTRLVSLSSANYNLEINTDIELF